MKWSKVAVACLLANCLLSSAHAISNLGFEENTFNGWTQSTPDGLIEVVTEHAAIGEADFRVYAPHEGAYFARLTPGATPDVATTISRTFTLGVGQTVSGAAAFDAQDYLPYDDSAYVRIQGPDGIVTLWSSSVTTVGGDSSSPWQVWSYLIPTQGSYTLTFGVINAIDENLPSVALFDAVNVPDGGSTLILLGAGLLGILAISRRQLKTITA